MTHAELVSLAARFCRGYCKCRVVATELRTFFAQEEPDVIGWACATGTSVVIECKTSRSDFRADAKKPHRIHRSMAMGNLVWYATPGRLLDPAEIPGGYGLVELGGDRARVVVKPTRNCEPNMIAERSALASIVRRITESDGLAPLASWCLPTIGEDAVEEVTP